MSGLTERCPVCGTPGRIVSSDEGTQHFAAAPSDDDLGAAGSLDVETLGKALNAYDERRWPLDDAAREVNRAAAREIAAEYVRLREAT